MIGDFDFDFMSDSNPYLAAALQRQESGKEPQWADGEQWEEEEDGEWKPQSSEV
jgi:hypothetical protein